MERMNGYGGLVCAEHWKRSNRGWGLKGMLLSKYFLLEALTYYTISSHLTAIFHQEQDLTFSFATTTHSRETS
jgi:hypothetical protein